MDSRAFVNLRLSVNLYIPTKEKEEEEEEARRAQIKTPVSFLF